MPYIKKEWVLRETIEVEKIHTGRYGAPGQKRMKRCKATPDDIKRQNEWNAQKKLRRIINANFGEDDLHTVLTYRKDERPSPEEAKEVLKKFFEQLRKEFKKLGQPLKYIIATEYKNHAIHHHIVINNIMVGQESTMKIVRKAWTRGRPKFVPMDDTGEYKDLAEYLIKETAKSFRDDDNPNKTRYSCSRNLIRPEPEKSIILAKEWREDPVPKKGYYIDKSSVVNGVNPVTGYRYQYYTMIKIQNIRSKRKDE